METAQSQSCVAYYRVSTGLEMAQLAALPRFYTTLS
jgi:hypothetical protein